MWWGDGRESEAEGFVRCGERWSWRRHGGGDQGDVRSLHSHLKQSPAQAAAEGHAWLTFPLQLESASMFKAGVTTNGHTDMQIPTVWAAA